MKSELASCNRCHTADKLDYSHGNINDGIDKVSQYNIPD